MDPAAVGLDPASKCTCCLSRGVRLSALFRRVLQGYLPRLLLQDYAILHGGRLPRPPRFLLGSQPHPRPRERSTVVGGFFLHLAASPGLPHHPTWVSVHDLPAAGPGELPLVLHPVLPLGVPASAPSPSCLITRSGGACLPFSLHRIHIHSLLRSVRELAVDLLCWLQSTPTASDIPEIMARLAAATGELGLLCSLRRFFLCVLLLVITASGALITPPRLASASAGSSSGSGSGKVVTSLPGYDGPLPFYLETGYVEVDQDNGAELFYYFVESESASSLSAPAGGAADVPFLLWLTGGDRCSVFSGLAYEIGPIRFVLEPYNGTLPRLRYNQNSWSKVSHILFVDSPVGAGFSFSRQPKGYDVSDISSMLQLHEFLIKWFSDHPKYLASPFYIGGDSYAGMLVPFLAQMVSEGIEAGRKPLINLTGYLVGNAATGESVDITSKVPYAHGVGIISDQLYETIMGHCKGQDYFNPSNMLCAQALGTFNNLINEVQQAQILLDTCVYASPIPNDDANNRMDGSDGRKILKEDIQFGRLNHPPARPPFGCITYGYYLSYYWANDKRTRDALGIKEGTKDEWVRCHDNDLPYSYTLQSVIKYHRNLTSRGYRALAYSGDHDLLVPHLGTQAWVRSLNFSVVDDWRAWHLGGQSAGFTISYSNNMTFATIKGGGHTAPEYEPERCFAMFSRWILNRPL